MLLNNANDTTILKYTTQDDINSITKDSPIHLLNALYQCENIIEVDKNDNPILNNDEMRKSFTYKSSFYLSFLSNQDNLSNEYLEARKSLYKSISQIKKEKQKQELQELTKQQEILEQSLQNLDSKQKEAQLKELQREQEKALRDKLRQHKNQSSNQHFYNKDTNQITLQSQDKSITIIFLDKRGKVA